MESVDPAETLHTVGYVCPSCAGELTRHAGALSCSSEKLTFGLCDGIRDFVLPDRDPIVGQFLEGYRALRTAEGWGSDDLEYYRKLPFDDLSGRHSDIWRVRSRSFRAFLGHLRTLDAHEILDLGAGNGWLSRRLGLSGYAVWAVDVNTDSADGLGTLVRFPPEEVRNVVPVRAEYAHLPFRPGSFDVLVCNASAHYVQEIVQLIESLFELLRPDGNFYLIDSPLYNSEAAGLEMVRRRVKSIADRFACVVPPEFAGSFLTEDVLEELRGTFDVNELPTSSRVRDVMARVLRIKHRTGARFGVFSLSHKTPPPEQEDRTDIHL